MPDGLFANPLHWAILIVVVLIIFGPGKLPGVGSALGHSLREFKKASQDDHRPAETAAVAGIAAASVPAPDTHGVACPTCGAANGAEAQSCTECGGALAAEVSERETPPPSGPLTCAACSAENPAGNLFCAHCGRVLEPAMDRV